MVRKKIRQLKERESGDILILFACSLVVLLSLVALAIDIGMVNMKKAHMMDLVQQMRQARLDAKDYIMNADDPAVLIYKISNQCAIDNGFTGNVKVYYQEVSVPAAPTSEWVESRTYKVRVELKQELKYIFAGSLFSGSDTKQITIYLDGGEQKSAQAEEGIGELPVWYPHSSGGPRIGSYSRTDTGGIGNPQFLSGDLPAGW